MKPRGIAMIPASQNHQQNARGEIRAQPHLFEVNPKQINDKYAFLQMQKQYVARFSPKNKT